MKKSDLREQFEKETDVIVKDPDGDIIKGLIKSEYVEWLETINSEMIDALVEAKQTIKSWHGEEAWDLYQHSPEMKKINKALKKAGCVDAN